MDRHGKSHEQVLQRLDALCEQCRGLGTNQQERIGQAIRKACDSCKALRGGLSRLAQLQQSLTRFNATLLAARGV